MADKNYVITLNVDASGAVSNLGEVEQQITDTTEKTAGLKQQLRALQLEMQKLDPSDAKFQELSEQAGALKDQMNDTADAIRNNAGSAFENLSNNASTLNSRLLSLDFSGAGQSAKAMAANIKSIDPKQLTEDFKGLLGGFKEIGSSLKTLGGSVISNLKSSFKSLGTTLLANPIFLIAAAIIAIGVAIKAGLDQQREDVDNANKAIDASNERRHREEKKRLASAQGDEAKLAQVKQDIAQKDIQDTEAKIQNLQAQQRTFYGISEEQEKTLDDLRKQLADQRVDYEVQAINQMNALNAARVELQTRYENIGLTSRQLTEKEMDASYKRETEALLAKGATEEELYKLDAIYEDKKNSLHRQYEDEDAAKRKQASDARKAQREKDLKESQEADKLEIELARFADNEILRMEQEMITAQNENDQQEIEAMREVYRIAKEIDDQKAAEDKARDKEEIEAMREVYRIADEMDATAAADKKKRQEETVQNASDGLNAIMALNDAFSGNSEREREKAFKRNKAFSIAQALINTYQAVNQQLANPVDSLTGANFVKAGIALAMGIANVAKIAKTKYEGGGPPPSTGGGGMGGMAGGNVGGSSAPTPSFNPIDFSILGQRPNQANQSFVLAGQVSNAQDANSKIKDLSRL